MPEAVTTAARAFAPPARGAVSSNEEAPVPQEPMQTPHPTSQSQHAPSASPRRAGRRSKLALAGALVLLVLLAFAGPAAAFSMRLRVHHRGPRLGTRRRHVAVGRLRLRQARLGLQGHPQALLHRDRVLERRRLGHPRQPAQRPERRQAQLPQRVHGAGLGRRMDHPGRHDRDDHLVEPRLQGRRRLAAQDLQRRADVHAQDRRAAPHHQDRPRRRRRLPRHHQGGAQRRAHDDQPRAARELPARASSRTRCATTWPMEALKTQACAARAFALGQPAAGQVLGRLLRRPRPGVHGRRHRGARAPTPPCGTPPASAPPTTASPSWRRTSPAPAGRPRTSSTSGAAATRTSRASATPTTPTARSTTGGPLRRTPSQIGGPLGAAGTVRAVYTRASAATRRGSSRRRSSAAPGPASSTAAPCA